MRQDEILKCHTYVDCAGNTRQVISVNKDKGHVVYREVKGDKIFYSKVFLNYFSRWAYRDITYDYINGKDDVRDAGSSLSCTFSEEFGGSECGSPWCPDCGGEADALRARAESAEKMLEFAKKDRELLARRMEDALNGVNDYEYDYGDCNNDLNDSKDSRLKEVLNNLGMDSSFRWKDVIRECATEFENIDNERAEAVKRAEELMARFSKLYNKYTIARLERDEAVSRSEHMYRGIVAYRASFGCHNADGWGSAYNCAACAWERSMAGPDDDDNRNNDDDASSNSHDGVEKSENSTKERDRLFDDGYVPPLSEKKTRKLARGIRDTVRWLREKGFHTFDSHDGELNDKGTSEGFAYVHITVEPERMVSEARRLARVLLDAGVPMGDMHYNEDADLTTQPSIECSYSPCKPSVDVCIGDSEKIGINMGIISLYDVNDEMLNAALNGTWRKREEENADEHES